MIIETVEPSIVISISYENMQAVLERVCLELNGGRRAIIAAMYIQKDARAVLQLLKAPKNV